MNSESSHLSAKYKLRPSKSLIDMLQIDVISGTVLDYGCGKGADIDYLLSIKPDLNVYGYDPRYFPILVHNLTYDTIFCNNVINYIKTPTDIKSFLIKMKCLLKKGGKLILTARSVGEVKGNVKRNSNWKYIDKFNGYYSSESDIFQRGYDTSELVELVESINLNPVNDKYNIKPTSYAYVIAEKK